MALTRTSPSALMRAFGGSSPARSGGFPTDYDSDRVSAYNVATKQLPQAILSASPQLLTHGLAAALDKSALGAKISSTLGGVKVSTLGLGLSALTAIFAPRRKVRRGALALVVGFLHAKLHEPAAALPELVTAVAQKAGVAGS